MSKYTNLIIFNISRDAASDYLRKAGDTHGTVEIQISIGKFL